MSWKFRESEDVRFGVIIPLKHAYRHFRDRGYGAVPPVYVEYLSAFHTWTLPTPKKAIYIAPERFAHHEDETFLIVGRYSKDPTIETTFFSTPRLGEMFSRLELGIGIHRGGRNMSFRPAVEKRRVQKILGEGKYTKLDLDLSDNSGARVRSGPREREPEYGFEMDHCVVEMTVHDTTLSGLAEELKQHVEAQRYRFNNKESVSSLKPTATVS